MNKCIAIGVIVFTFGYGVIYFSTGCHPWQACKGDVYEETIENNCDNV